MGYNKEEKKKTETELLQQTFSTRQYLNSSAEGGQLLLLEHIARCVAKIADSIEEKPATSFKEETALEKTEKVLSSFIKPGKGGK